MRLNFGSRFSVVSPFGERPADPSKPDSRAREEMFLFDQLEPSVRAAFANSLYGAPVTDIVRDVSRRGANDAVKRVLKERGLKPCDVGTEGVIVETVRLEDERETQRIRSVLVS